MKTYVQIKKEFSYVAKFSTNLIFVRTACTGSCTLKKVLIRVFNKTLDTTWTRPFKTQCPSKLPSPIYQTSLSSKTKRSSVTRVMKSLIWGNLCFRFTHIRMWRFEYFGETWMKHSRTAWKPYIRASLC